MKLSSLRPYPGRVMVCESREEFYRLHKREFGEPSVSLDGKYGRMSCQWSAKKGGTYLVWAVDKERLSHELAHVCLHVFELVSIDPRDAGGEPFCYLLSQLMLDAK